MTDDDLAKALDDLLLPPVGATSNMIKSNFPTEVEKISRGLEEYAAKNAYPGIGVPGEDTFCGWPVHTLLSKIHPSQRAAVLADMKHRNNIRTSIPSRLGGLKMQAPAQPSHPKANALPHRLEDMLAMRMRWGVGQWAEGFAHVAVHNMNDDVHIWIITKDGQSAVLTDELSLYPSDALVTKVRLLQGEK